MIDETFVEDASNLNRWCHGCERLIGQCMTPSKRAFLDSNPNMCPCCMHPHREHTYAGCQHMNCSCKWVNRR